MYRSAIIVIYLFLSLKQNVYAWPFYRDREFNVKTQYIGGGLLSSLSIASDINNELLKGYYAATVDIDYVVAWGNKGLLSVIFSPGIGAGIDLRSVSDKSIDDKVNYLPNIFFVSARVNLLTWHSWSIFSALESFGQIRLDTHDGSIMPRGFIRHQIGFGYNVLIKKTIISMSCGFAQAVHFMSADALNNSTHSIVLDNTVIGSDFRLWGTVSVAFIYKITNNTIFRTSVDYMMPIPIVEPNIDYFMRNNVLFVNIGFRKMW